MTTRIKLRRDTEANWLSNDPVLALGEAGHDTTNNELRIGDGTSTWSTLAAIGGGSTTSGKILLSENESHQLTLSNDGYLLGGSDGYDDIRIGQTDDNEDQRAYILISQDDPYIRSEVLSSTSNNYRNEMVWHNPWYSRYSKIYTNAYGAHIQNAQWSGPGNDYFNRFSFTRDGVFNMPPAAVIRSNDFQSSYWAPQIGDINDDSSVDPGTDSSLTFDANTVSIARGSLNMNGVSNLPLNNNGNGYWIAMAGTFGQENASTAQEGSCMDLDGNTYTLQVADDDGDTLTGVTKWSPAGERLWQRVLFQDDSTGSPTYSVYPLGIGVYSNTLTIALNDYSDARDRPLFMYIDKDDGLNVDPGDTFVSPTVDLEINDCAISPDNGGIAAVGRAATGTTYLTPSFVGVAANTVQNGYCLVVNREDTFGPPGDGSPFPTPDTQNQFYMFGDGITGNVAINAVNTVGGLSATRVSGSGTGTDAVFTATWNTGSYVVSVTTPGSNYNNNDQLKILGSDLGGISPTNDITFSITTDAGAITGVTSPTGTANVAVTVLGLSGDPVDFSAIATPTILVNTSTDSLFITGYVYYPGTTYSTFGNVGWDTFNAVAFDTISSGGYTGNVYVGGRYHPTGNSGPRRSVLAKLASGDGPYIVWQKELDDYTGRNEIRGIAVDGEGNVYTVAENNNVNTTVTKVNSEGVMQWQRIINNTTFSPTYDHTTYGIGVNSQNHVIVTGLSVRGDDFDGDNEDITIVAFNSDGDMVWARTLGTPQDEFSQWDRTFDNITVKDDTMIITGRSYAGGFRVTHPSDSVGFVAKLPADGTGVGHYGEWRYLETAVEIETVANTAANVATMTFTNNDITTTSNTYAYANIAVRSGGMAPEFGLPSVTYQLGGPGAITGLNQLRFTNGATITNVAEEGLMLWQPDPTAAQLTADLHNAEYIAMGYGGTSGENANIQISAGTYNWAIEDDNLEAAYYPDNGFGQSQRQVNIDIKAEGGDADNISNWHFDENGSMYLPAQSGYNISAQLSPTDFIGGQPNATAILTIDLAAYPKVANLVQIGDFVVDPTNQNIKGTVIHTQANATPTLWDITVSQAWVDALSVPGVIFTNQQTNGIVFSDGSKQQTAGRKIIPGFPGQENIARSFGTSYNLAETLIWTASSADVSAFRGTVRCQYNDSSTAMKIYDVVGASSKNGNLWADGFWDMTVTILIEVGESVAETTFRVDIDQADLTMRIYATAPANQTVYMTTDITEFKYTYD
jgi:hypothetical protein